MFVRPGKNFGDKIVHRYSASVQLDWRKARLETLAVHAGHSVDESTGAVSAPIHLSTTFQREADGSFPHGYMYTRNSNPNRVALENALAALEGGATAAAFATGMAASAAIFQALKPGDYMVAPADAYYGTNRVLREVFQRWGLEVDFIDMTAAAELDQAFKRNPQLVWIETPSNPLLKIIDIASVAESAHQAGAICVCDNTWAPALQRPLNLGADLVMHSTTKYIGGHCDVAGGVVVARERNGFFEAIRTVQIEAGGVPSPFDCWLVLRGLRTLPWRMRAHSQNALAVATFLAGHPHVEAVYYPGLPNHPGHKIAGAQMREFSGMLSFQVKGGREAAMRVAANTKIFIRATSLGGVESLIEHRASIEGPATRAPENLLRVSVGLEHADDLIEDLDQAFG
jgi:cystathionine gamma-synthase